MRQSVKHLPEYLLNDRAFAEDVAVDLIVAFTADAAVTREVVLAQAVDFDGVVVVVKRPTACKACRRVKWWATSGL